MLPTSRAEPALLAHHPDMLIARVRRSAAPHAGRLTRDAVRRAAPGLHALHRHEQDGLLHYVVPLGREARRRVARSGRSGQVAAALRAAAQEQDRRPHTGHVLIHLKREEHRAALHRALRRDPHVADVSRVPTRYLWLPASSDANQAGAMLPPERLWNHARIQLHAARRLPEFRVPSRIRVAVLDSGVQARHPSLRNRIHSYVHSWERGHPFRTTARDLVGHGTHISGIINARHERVLGVHGITHCKLTVMKVFDDRLDALPAEQARVFLVNPAYYRWSLAECVSRRFDVVNLSLGGPAPPDPQEAALLTALLAKGTTIVAAMGNALSHRDQPAYPAAFPGVIAVGAVGPDDKVAAFSRRGPHIALCAPGVAIWSTLSTYPGEFGFFDAAHPAERRSRGRPLSRNTRFDSWPGTSGACPHVTAAVALLLASKGRMSPARVKARLMRSADKVSGMKGKTFDPSYGAGRLNLKRLLEGKR